MDHSVVQRWLRGVVTQYPESDKVYLDTDRALTAVSSLSPKTEVYTYDDGRTQLLIQLKGTIAIQFRNNTYNIPIEIWIQRAYPREPPIVYVTPTSDMLVRKGKHVDVSGRVEGGYLEAWSRKWEGCNILSLIHDLQQIFGREPPVYAKPTGTSSSQAQTKPPASPSISSPQVSSPSNSSARERGPPAPPTPDPTPHDSYTSARLLSSNSSSGTSGPPAPPVPPAPPKPGQASSQTSLDFTQRSFSPPHHSTSPYQHSQGHIQPPNGHAYSPSAASPLQHQQYSQKPPHVYQHQQQQLQYQQPPPGPQFSQAGPSRSGSLDSQARFASPISPPVQGAVPSPPWANAPSNQATEHHNQVESVLSQPARPNLPPPLPPQPTRQQDLLDSIELSASSKGQVSEAPAPPRPLNPELLALHTSLNDKFTSRLHSLQSALRSADSQLEILNSDLKRGEPAIRDEMKRLEAVRDVCRTRRERLEELNRKGEERFQFLKSKEEPDMEGIVCATSIVGNQLLDLVAEDNAIEDTIYHLGRALNSERIDLASFLKQTRYLAREQFMRRALSQKIAEGMGWSREGNS